MAWMSTVGSALVSPANPVMPSKVVGPDAYPAVYPGVSGGKSAKTFSFCGLASPSRR